MKRNFHFFIFLLFLFFGVQSGFSKSIDSLKIAISSLSEKDKFETYLNEGNKSYLQDSHYSRACCESARKIAESSDDSVLIAKSNYCIARAILINGDVETPLFLLNECASIFEKNKMEIDFGDALSLKALLLRRIGDHKSGTETLKKAIDIFEKNDDKLRLMKCLINISLDYMDEKEYNYAYDHLARADQINKIVNDTTNQFYIDLNLGNLFLKTNNYSKSLIYFNKSFQIAAERKMTDALVTNLVLLGNVYAAIDNNEMAIQKYITALDKANEYQLPHEKLEALEQLNLIYRKQNDFESALNYYEQYVILRDSMYSLERISRIDHLEKKLDVEEKEKQLTQNKLEIETQNLLIVQQKNQQYIFITALVAALVIIVFVVKIYRDKKKANEIIFQQKNEVELKKDEIEEKNKEILDSINYAKRIQMALLKSEEKIADSLPPHFIVFKPKDIVSGDFYWAYDKQHNNENYIYVAAADCTGHGVPGGFMSMLSIAFLNEIAGKEKLLTPAEILEELRSKVIKELGQTGKIGGSKDGLDISLSCIKKINDKVELQWAGANNPLWIITKNEVKELVPEIDKVDKKLYELKANKQPIGYFADNSPFLNHKINLPLESTILMFSDGFADQFGGEKGKKYKYKPFKELLLSINELSLDLQKKKIEESFENWRGNLEQIDDVCVVGIKVS